MKAKQRALWWVWCVPLIGFVSPPKQKLKQFRECAFDIWVLICANKRQRVIQRKNKRERQRVEGGCVGPLPSTTVLCLIMLAPLHDANSLIPLFMKSWQIGNWLSYDPTQPKPTLWLWSHCINFLMYWIRFWLVIIYIKLKCLNFDWSHSIVLHKL